MALLAGTMFYSLRHFRRINRTCTRYLRQQDYPRIQIRRWRSKLSVLFVSNADSENTAVVDLDIDVENYVNKLNELEVILARRRMTAIDLNKWVEDYKLYRKMKDDLDHMQEERNQISRQFAELKKQKSMVEEKKEELTRRGKELRISVQEMMKPFWEIEEKVHLAALKFPNTIHANVPDDDTVLQVSSSQTFVQRRDVGIIELLKRSGALVFSPLGPTAYYMKGELAILEQAIYSYATDCLEREGFQPVVCPDMVKALVMEGCGVGIKDGKESLRLKDADNGNNGCNTGDGSNLASKLFLTGSSHFGMVASLTRMMVNDVSMPMKSFTVGRSYRPVKEQGTNDLLSVSQAGEFHLFSSCRSRSEAEAMMSQFQDVIKRLYQPFDCQTRLVNIGAKNLHPAESRRMDFDCWIPSVEKFTKLASVSCCDDYISRRLMMQWSSGMASKPKKFQHIVHGSALIVPTFLTAVLETSPDNGEKVILPEVLKSHWIGTLPDDLFKFQDS